MPDKKFEELSNTKCKMQNGDAYDHHYWISIGVVGETKHLRLWYCTQCQKYITERLERLMDKEKE